jgi:hypothetical protein
VDDSEVTGNRVSLKLLSLTNWKFVAKHDWPLQLCPGALGYNNCGAFNLFDTDIACRGDTFIAV